MKFSKKHLIVTKCRAFSLQIKSKISHFVIYHLNFGTHCKDFFEIFHNAKILNRVFKNLSLGTAIVLSGSIHHFQIQAIYVYCIVVSIPVHLEVAASKLFMIYIVGGNYCKLIINLFLQNEGHLHLKLSPKCVNYHLHFWNPV